MNLSPPSNTLSMASPFHRNQTSPPGTTTGTSTRPIAVPLGLSRYDSAPGSFLSTMVSSSDHHPATTSAAGTVPSHVAAPLFGRFFAGESSSSSPSMTSDSSCKVGPPDQTQQHQRFASGSGHHHEVGNQDPNPLVRHSSSPAGFFSNLLMDNNYPPTANNRRLKSQLSFTRQSALSQISEDGIPDLGGSIGGGSGTHSDETRSYGFSIGSWDDTNSIVFSAPANKRGKDNNGDIITNLSNIDSQFGFPRASLDLQMQQQDQVAFKVRAKRGCATHPRSIAERERRTRISEKLRKLEELVPNMDKQTSTADMLDLAVQQIKVLQNQVEILKKEQENCTCGNHRRNDT